MNAHSTHEPVHDPEDSIRFPHRTEPMDTISAQSRFSSVSPEREREVLAEAQRKGEFRKSPKPVKVPRTYLVGMEGSPLVKIGFTSGDPKKRLKSLQTGQPMTLSLLWSVQGDHEDMLHERFATYRVRGEWFDLSSLGDPVQVVEEALRLPEKGLTIPKQAAPAQEEGAQKPIGVRLDCVCGHSNKHHRYKSCTAAGWDEWLDCQCTEYTSKSVLDSVRVLTRVPDPRPVTNGWQGPMPPEKAAAVQDVRYVYVLHEITRMIWPGGGPMVPGDWAEYLATCIVWRLRGLEDRVRLPAVVLDEVVRLQWPHGAVMVPGAFAEQMTDRIMTRLSNLTAG